MVLEVRLTTAAFTGNDLALDDFSLVPIPEESCAEATLQPRHGEGSEANKAANSPLQWVRDLVKRLTR